MLNWHYSNVDQVAAILAEINPSFCFSSHEAGVIAIKERVEREMTRPGYLATFGFCATVWADEDFNLHVKVTLEPYGVAKYLNSGA